MAWERRANGKRYYYRSRRDGDRTIKIYVGGGEQGRAAAAADDAARRQRHARKQATIMHGKEWAALLNILDLGNIFLAAATIEQLLAAGWKKPARTWRSPRYGHDAQTPSR